MNGASIIALSSPTSWNDFLKLSPLLNAYYSAICLSVHVSATWQEQHLVNIMPPSVLKPCLQSLPRLSLSQYHRSTIACHLNSTLFGVKFLLLRLEDWRAISYSSTAGSVYNQSHVHTVMVYRDGATKLSIAGGSYCRTTVHYVIHAHISYNL